MAEPEARPQRPQRSRPPFNRQKKRKRPADDAQTGSNAVPISGDRDFGGAEATATAPPPTRKPKEKKPKNKKQKTRREPEDDADLDTELGLNRAIGGMDRYLLADHLARQTRRFGSDLSSIELADLHIKSSSILDTSSYEKDRTMANLPDFLETFAGKSLNTAPKANGAPHTIVVTGAGLRAADLVRALRPFQTATNTVSKLFAKHIKLAEAVSFLQSHRTGIAVGTPARLIDLLENGALSVAHLRRIVVDASHIDMKKRGVLDMQDTTLPVARWLARPEFQERYDADAAEENKEGKDKEGDKAPPLSILFY